MIVSELNEKINEWKEEYRAIYKTDIADETIIWRTITRKEYIEVMSMESELEELLIFERELAIAKACILFPEDSTELLDSFAGVAEVIARECMNKSGFGENKTEKI